mgnify:CR=1 FL=1
MTIFILPLSLFFLSILFLKITRPLFKKKIFTDKPSGRSNHIIPTPKGAGLILIPLVIFSTLLVFFWEEGNYKEWLPFFICAFILMIISFIDDIKNLSSRLRLTVQLGCVIFSIFFFIDEIRISSSLLESFKYTENNRLFIDFFLIISFSFVWMWIINLFNFMDGMDGITASQVCLFSLGVNFLSLFNFLEIQFQQISLIVFSVFFAFFIYNKPPAKIFLGDVGSIPIGYIVGLIVIKCIIINQLFIPLIILLMYHILDSTITLVLRIIKRQNILEAHSTHFYQKILRAGYSHEFVLNRLLVLYVLLFCLSIISTLYPIESLLTAFILTSYLLRYFSLKSMQNE